METVIFSLVSVFLFILAAVLYRLPLEPWNPFTTNIELKQTWRAITIGITVLIAAAFLFAAITR